MSADKTNNNDLDSPALSKNDVTEPTLIDQEFRTSSVGGSSTSGITPVLRPNLLWRLLRIPFRLFCHCWIRLRIHGQEHIDSTRGGLFLVNHQSFLDPLLVAVFLNRPVSYLARDSLFRVPVVGWILRNTYVIPISREAARGGSIRVAVERLESGFLVGIFPEGTRSVDGEVRTFRPGFLALARRTQQPIYPVGIVGADRIMPRGAWWIRPGRVQIVFGSPMSASELNQLHTSKDDGKLCELARGRVAACTEMAHQLLGNTRHLPTSGTDTSLGEN
jgi:1-acyl-sn-glycerol-3-phosphate acyltransferase